MSYQAVGALLGAALERRDWTHQRLADALKVGRPYITNVIAGRNPVSAETLAEMLDAIEATPEERTAMLRARRQAQRAAEARSRARRASRRGRPPLDMADGPVPEVTDAEVAQFVGAMKALGFTRAKIEALLATAGIP